MSCHDLHTIATDNLSSSPKNNSWSSWQILCLHLRKYDCLGIHEASTVISPISKESLSHMKGLMVVLKDRGSVFKPADSWIFYSENYYTRIPLPTSSLPDNSTEIRLKFNVSKINKASAWIQYIFHKCFTNPHGGHAHPSLYSPITWETHSAGELSAVGKSPLLEMHHQNLVISAPNWEGHGKKVPHFMTASSQTL